ncbi:MAG: CDP-alcohol phosphatidyltransferase family protein [Bacteroidota bacterium]
MKQHLPNFITLCNLFFGCIAVIFAVMNQLELAILFVFFGIVCDFLDGLAARLLKVSSEIGVQLDSLADLVTSGLVPGIVMFQLLHMSQQGGWNIDLFGMHTSVGLVPLLGFLITLASAYRLANFNVDENQVSSFRGLPTPANAILILSLPLILIHHDNAKLHHLILSPWFLIGLTLLSTYLLNARITLFALKFKGFGFVANKAKYLFLIGSCALLLIFGFAGIPLVILLYIGSSLLFLHKIER